MNTTIEMGNIQNVIDWLENSAILKSDVIGIKSEAQAAASVLRALVKVQNPPTSVNLSHESLKTIREAYVVAFGPLPPEMYGNDVDSEIVTILREAGHAGKHPDDVEIDQFCDHMKARMREMRAHCPDDWRNHEQMPISTLMSYWEECAIGKPIDSAVYSMMLFHRFQRS